MFFLMTTHQIDLLIEQAIAYSIPILKGSIVLVIGWFVVDFLIKTTTKIIRKQKIDETLKPFLVVTIKTLLRVALILAVIQTMGFAITSFIAILGTAGLAVGLALQGSLSNFAGGVLLLIFRPIKVGEYIKAQGEEGIVREIQLFVTIIETLDDITIFLPNSSLANSSITNLSRKGRVRLNIAIGISYNANIAEARKVLLNVMQQNTLVLKNPKSSIIVSNLGDSSVDLLLRPWCDPVNLPTVTASITEAAKIALDNAGIEIPFPQRVIHQAK